MDRTRPAGVAARLAVALALALGSLAAPAVVLGGDPCFHDESRPALGSGTGTTVKLDTCAFFPAIARVVVGTTVTFLNGSELPHLVTGANLGWGSHTTNLAPGASIRYRFDEPGVFPFSCMLHPGMTGAIVVGDGAGPAAGGPVASSGGPPSGAAAGPLAGVGAVVGAGGLIALAALAAFVGLVGSRDRARRAVVEVMPAEAS
jgi:plastocyanin